MAAPSGISNAVRVFRSPAVRGSLITAAILLIVSGLRGGLDLWWLAAATVAALTGALLAGMERQRPAPAPVAAREERLFAADTLLASIPDRVVLVDRRAVVRSTSGRPSSSSSSS
jgi:two-component system phosphate regulon sensor histidine kinase PhoR